MLSIQSQVLYNRLHAASLLAERLMEYQNSNAIVVAIPRGGVPVGYHVGESLNLPLELVMCEKIMRPSARNESMGSVSTDSVFMHDEPWEIPQSFLTHQVSAMQRDLREKENFYRNGIVPLSLKKKTIILVNDQAISGDSMLAGLQHIQKQEPLKIVAAIPVISPEAYNTILPLVDRIVFLIKESTASFHVYEELPRVKEEDVRELFSKAHSEFIARQYVM